MSYKQRRPAAYQPQKLMLWLLANAALLTACTSEEQGVSTNAAQAGYDKLQSVEVVVPTQRSFKAEVLITGTTRPNQMVTLYAMESGMLRQMHKDIGDKVRQGKVIAVMENPELYQQQIRWQAETRAKKANYDRLNSVYQKTPALTNIQMVENAEAEYLTARASLEAVNSRIGFLTISAPFSGIVTKRFVDKGAMIQSGLSEDNAQAIVEIQEVDPIRLTLPVPESDAVGIKKGMNATVTLPELSGKSWNAKISRIARALDPVSKTMQVEIDLNNANGEIISGMYAKVLIQLESRKGILSLPVAARINYNNEDYVWTVEQGRVRRTRVKTGFSDANYFEILNPEITAATEVIIVGKGLVAEGQLVEPKRTTEQ